LIQKIYIRLPQVLFKKPHGKGVTFFFYVIKIDKSDKGHKKIAYHYGDNYGDPKGKDKIFVGGKFEAGIYHGKVFILMDYLRIGNYRDEGAKGSDAEQLNKSGY
jgi:hypothetical protein